MFAKIKRFFNKNNKSKVNLTTSGETLLVNEEIEHPTITKMRNSENLNMTEIGLVMSDLFDSKVIEGKFHKFHKVLVEDSVFELSAIKLVELDGDKLISIEMSEVAFGIRMNISIDPREFHGVFKHHTLNKLGDKR